MPKRYPEQFNPPNRVPEQQGFVDPFSRPVGRAEAARVGEVFPRPGVQPRQPAAPQIQDIQPLLQILSQMAGPAMQGMQNFQNQAQQMEQERQLQEQQQRMESAAAGNRLFGNTPNPAEQQRLANEALQRQIRQQMRQQR